MTVVQPDTAFVDNNQGGPGMARTIIYLGRHAKAEPAKGKSHAEELGRDLTPDGWDQAAALGELIGNVKFDQVFSSTAARCLLTAVTVTGFDPKDIVELEEISIADPALGGDALVLHEAYGRHKEHPAALWLEDPLCTTALRSFGYRGSAKLRSLFSDRDQVIYVSGHAVFQPMIGFTMMNRTIRAFGEELLQLLMPEASAIKLVFDYGVFVEGEVLKTKVPTPT